MARSDIRGQGVSSHVGGKAFHNKQRDERENSSRLKWETALSVTYNDLGVEISIAYPFWSQDCMATWKRTRVEEAVRASMRDSVASGWILRTTRRRFCPAARESWASSRGEVEEEGPTPLGEWAGCGDGWRCGVFSSGEGKQWWERRSELSSVLIPMPLQELDKGLVFQLGWDPDDHGQTVWRGRRYLLWSPLSNTA